MDLIIRTQFDGKDYRSVEGIYYIDNIGDLQEHKAATEACIDISTCADQGTDTWFWIQEKVAKKLKAASITYHSLHFDEDEPCP